MARPQDEIWPSWESVHGRHGEVGRATETQARYLKESIVSSKIACASIQPLAFSLGRQAFYHALQDLIAAFV